MTQSNVSTPSSTLPQFVQLTIQGEDAEKFLQGHLTSDVTLSSGLAIKQRHLAI